MASKRYYSPEFGLRMGVNNSGPVFNEGFSKWNQVIEKGLGSFAFPDYTWGHEGRAFLKDCLAHRDSFAKPLDAPNVVVLVHPFYTWLSNFNYIHEGSSEKDLDTYTQRLLSLLRGPINRRELDIVAFETTYHYSAFSSRLLEQGELDAVFFTENDRGELLDRKDAKRFKGKRIYLAGGYNDRCLCKSGERLKTIVDESNLFVVSDLVVRAPYERDDILIPSDKGKAIEILSPGFKVTPERLVTHRTLMQAFRSPEEPKQVQLELGLKS